MEQQAPRFFTSILAISGPLFFQEYLRINFVKFHQKETNKQKPVWI